MNTPTYKEQFDKITEAYIKGDIKPFDCNFCFCGTLCNNKKEWYQSTTQCKHKYFMHYTGGEYVQMEKALLIIISKEFNSYYGSCFGVKFDSDKYEDALFNGMCAALEVLKDIHKARGENVDEEFVFTKRELSISI